MSPIKGLTDRQSLQPRFPRLGKLRKGAEKPRSGWGKDLEHFRFTSDRQDVIDAFTKAYGDKPRQINVYLPYDLPDDNFSTWREKWSAGGLVHRCDGEMCVIHRTAQGYSRTPKKCDGGCKEVGRLSVLIPELIAAGFVGYVTLETHSKHDLMNIMAVLLAASQDGQTSLKGIPFVLRRYKDTISTPGKDGKRARREKWLVSLEPQADWYTTRLALARASAFEADVPQLPSGTIVDGETGELLQIDIENGSQPEVEAEPVMPERNWAADIIAALVESDERIKGPKQAVKLLNLSGILSENEAPDIVLQWLGEYDKARTAGEDSDSAAAIADDWLADSFKADMPETEMHF